MVELQNFTPLKMLGTRGKKVFLGLYLFTVQILLMHNVDFMHVGMFQQTLLVCVCFSEKYKKSLSENKFLARTKLCPEIRRHSIINVKNFFSQWNYFLSEKETLVYREFPDFFHTAEILQRRLNLKGKKNFQKGPRKSFTNKKKKKIRIKFYLKK